MAAITLRGMNNDTLERLRAMARENGASMNRLILGWVEENLGKPRKAADNRYHDLDDLFGQMPDEDAACVAASSAEQRKIDPELWES